MERLFVNRNNPSDMAIQSEPSHFRFSDLHAPDCILAGRRRFAHDDKPDLAIDCLPGQFFASGLEHCRQNIAAVKAIRPELEVGFHIEHVNSFNPIFRATRSYVDLAGIADFLKSSSTTTSR